MPKYYVDFRIDEEDAARYLPDDAGRRLGPSRSTRQVEAGPADPLFATIGAAQRLERANGGFFLSWQGRRVYTKAELAAAELFSWMIEAAFEPTGEDCGTIYDESTACPVCGAGRTQVSELVLDLHRVPKKDVAISIGGEVVVNERFADLLRREEMTGIELRPVRHRARAPRRIPEPRFQVIAEAPPAPVKSPPTIFGSNPFDLDEAGEFRCPFGHVAGLNLLTEVSIARDTWTASDYAETRELVGRRSGVVMSEPIRLISPRFFKLLQAERIKGSKVEVAYLV